MRCGTCQFENIPGVPRCIRCGSILEAAGGEIVIHPPRMPSWRRPFRAAVRWMRGRRVTPAKVSVPWIRKGFDSVASDSLFGLVLSIIPGLAHLIHGRFREVWWLVLLWLLALGAGLFLYGSEAGQMAIGLAVGLHAWIAVRFGLFTEITELRERLGVILIVLAVLGLFYWSAFRWATRDLVGGYTAMTIPAMNTHAGDYFWARRLDDPNDLLPRGTLVLIPPQGFINAEPHGRANPRHLMVGQIVGLPGESIGIWNQRYVAGGQPLDPNSYPIPRWLQRHPFRSGASVPIDSYFISTEYTVNVHGQATLEDRMIRNACTFKKSAVRGRAFLRWWPLERREFIE